VLQGERDFFVQQLRLLRKNEFQATYSGGLIKWV